jgi:hypothetical protein
MQVKSGNNIWFRKICCARHSGKCHAWPPANSRLTFLLKNELEAPLTTAVSIELKKDCVLKADPVISCNSNVRTVLSFLLSLSFNLYKRLLGRFLQQTAVNTFQIPTCSSTAIPHYITWKVISPLLALLKLIYSSIQFSAFFVLTVHYKLINFSLSDIPSLYS